MSSHMRGRIHVKSYEEEDTCQVICGGGYMSSHMRRRIPWTILTVLEGT